MQHIYENFLHRVTKPGRYLGIERHPECPDMNNAALSVVLCFPDTYEIGMSHLGLRLLFELLCREKDIHVDLAFAPWIDLEAELRDRKLPLISQFSHEPLSNFDIIGFSLQTELCFSNILNMLNLCGIELKAEQREANRPLIIAGGPVASNPAPFSDFMDAFLIGDGEEALIEAVNILKGGKKQQKTRQEQLTALKTVEGFYVPALHQENEIVKRRWVPELIADLNPTAAILPVIQTIQDRLAIEVLRGCTQGCRFCQAGYIYRPAREISVPQIVKLATAGIDKSGYDELSLVSLSTADYSDSGLLISELVATAAEKKVAISLPSLRADSFSFEIADYIGHVRQTGFTFAPESGSEQLRQRLNKNISDQDLLGAVRSAFERGWHLVKLYFMIGLPGETEDDIEQTIKLISQMENIARNCGRNNKIHVAFGGFIPKAHTPFQWESFLDPEKLHERLFYIKNQVSSKIVQFKWQSPKQSTIEAIISRGDQKIGQVLLKAFQKGSRFESWTEHFNYDRLIESLKECGIEPHEYYKARELDEKLPWDFIDAGVKKSFLLKEREKSFLNEPQPTPDCRKTGCNFCGIPGNGNDLALKHIEPQPKEQIIERLKKVKNSFTLRSGNEDKSNTIRCRLTYTKTGLARFLGHSDLVRILQMAVRAAGLPVLYSKGFTPRPAMQFGPVLPLGVESIGEMVDIWFLSGIDNKIETLNSRLPENINVTALQTVENNAPGSDRQLPLASFSISFPPEMQTEMQEKYQIWQKSNSWPTENRQKKLDLKTAVRQLEIREHELFAILPMTATKTANVNPYLLLEAVFNIPRDENNCCRIIKTGSLPEKL
jgi:radical SAM family uncharacterized protein/radical SAM-linked protein